MRKKCENENDSRRPDRANLVSVRAVAWIANLRYGKTAQCCSDEQKVTKLT